ncbi:MAG: tetratricopeptide repeat protein [Bacteroidales bacterium]|jgi:tetratricopeptide (TPR) repeat protein|nr:tetratricopeptide repeat protein [Bacteroidales bacterium]
MNDFFDNDALNQEEDEQKELVNKFKHLIANNEPVFFSVEDFLEIIDYFVQEDDYDNIVASTDIALKLYPDNIDIALRRCQLIIDNPIEEYLECVKEVMRYAEPFGNDAAYIYRYLATDLFDFDQFEESLYFCRLALMKDPNDEEIWGFLIVAASNLPKQEAEITLFIESMAKANPYSAHIWHALALISLLFGKYENTLEYVEYSLTLNQNNIEAHRCKAEALLCTGKIDEGMALLQKILKKEPENSQILYSLAGAYDQTKDWEKAIYYYKKAFTCDKENVSALMNVGLCYFSLNDFNTARNYANRAIEAEPDNIYFKLAYANMLYEAGYKEDGENLYREIYADFDEKELCAMNWARTIAKDGRLNDALNILNSTIDSRNIEDPGIYYTLIDLAAASKGYGDMIDHYLHLLSLNFNVKEEDLNISCPNLMKNKEYKTLITQYIK